MSAIHLNETSFDALLASGQLSAVDFWAAWCGPCKMLAPTIDELAVEYEGRAAVAKLNIDDYPNHAVRYGVMSIPTVVFFKGGKEVGRKVGLMQVDAYRQELNANL